MHSKLTRFLCAMLTFVLVLSVSATVLAAETKTFADDSAANEQLNYSACNTSTNVLYEDVTEALNEAAEGQTVKLLTDTSGMYISIYENTVLDLNGCTLTANYVSGFGHIIDSSADNTGLLIPGRIMISNDNAQLPVKDGDGYRFVEVVKFNSATQLDGARYVFQPIFEEDAHAYLAAGAANSEVTIEVAVSWKDGEHTRIQRFIYSDDLVNGYIASYRGSNGGYGLAFGLTLERASEYTELSYDACVISGLKVVRSASNTNGAESENNTLTEDVTIDHENGNAFVAAGTLLEVGTAELVLTATKLDETQSDITLGQGEEMISMDVHVDGIAKDNTVPVLVTLNELALTGLNQGNIALYHVENGETVAMTRVYSLDEVDEHNEYYYDIATGTITMALASFSEVAVVANTENAWNGNFDYSWYSNKPATKSTSSDYIIANADQLAGFGAIVGGMNGQTQDSFAGKTVKLVADINIGDLDSENGIVFYPIGYYNSDGTYEKTNKAITSGLKNFEGTFDGNGHTVANFYQNTWEMKGDHDWYAPEDQYYRDGMGLFGRVYGGTVKNLTVSNFSSDGEITTTGTIAAYADFGATFENITIFNCNPRVYNIGNGGIVGCVGWYAKEATETKVTFKNITVDNSNKISALWGSYDVACGGIVGQYYPTSGQSSANYPKNAGIELINCHVAAQIDVYNDVCANYQYYAYRYAGMLIGSVRENETIDGHVYPKMDGITATGCTVHFGTWNDYYYCELVDNSTASYTHDYQMSRLVEIKAINGTSITYLDGTTGTVPASGRANYVIVDYTKGHGTENATCYHFKDGEVWTHDMGGIDTGIDENGDGQDDLKEDKQHLYLEFNNIVTGYGWGVTSKGLTDFDGVDVLDIKEGENEESVEKFAKATTAQKSYTTGTTVTIGKLFAANTENTVDIDTDNVQVFVSPADETSTAGGTYEANTTDWTQGKLTFTGIGAATITITDYNFCTPTTINVTIEDKEPVEKFEKLFTGDFLYRVGNAKDSTVALGSLFKASGLGTINNATVNVKIEALNDTAASGNYTANTTDWTQGKIQFSGTGVVKVTITDNDYCTPTELILEVVTAKNVTSVFSATANSVVLLNDVSGSFSVSGGYTLYGNGFTVTLPTDYQASYTAGFVGYVTMSGGNLDNVRIEGPVYPAMNIYQSQAQNSTTNKEEYFYNSILINSGNNIITNSYISGSRTAVCIRGANSVVIEDTTLSGGAVANLQIEGANAVTLRNLTTVQEDETDSYGKGVTAHGMGVMVGASTAEISIEGELNQYNWLSYAQWKAIVGSYESSFPYFYTNDKYAAYQHTRNDETYVNIAFIFACDWDTDKLNVENQTNKDIYQKMGDVTVSGYNGGVYSVAHQGTVTDEMYYASDYESTGFDPVAPVFGFDNTANHDDDDENNAADTYCVYDEATGIMKIGMTTDSRTLTISGASVKKDGATLQYTAYLNGTEISGDTVTINSASGTKQTLTFKASSTNKGYDKDGNEISGSIEYSWSIVLEVAVLSYPAPVWNMNDVYTFDAKSECIYVYYSQSTGYAEAVPIFSGIKVNYYDKNGNFVEQDLTSRTELPSDGTQAIKQDFTVTLDDGSTLTMNATGSYKSGVTSLYFTNYSDKVYAYPSDLKTDSWVRPSTTGYDFNISFTYQFTDPNGLSTEKITVNWYSAKADNVKNTVQWKKFDSTNGEEPECVTPDMLITLADGSQVRVDSLTGSEELLVWNMVTGQLDSAPILFVDSDAEAAYEVVHLHFSDGTEVKVIAEHGFWDYDLNKYVYLDENAAAYIGHSFAKQNGDQLDVVTLVDVVIETEVTTAWSPVTAGHLCYFVEGMLSMPGGVGGLFNIFEVDPETMTYDMEKMEQDIATYGLFTYEELKAYAPSLTEEMFEAAGGAYLKVSIGKGNLTMDELVAMIERYSKFFE